MPDPLTVKQRSYCMSRVRGKNTKPEMLVRSALHKRGLRSRKHRKELPGRPDIVFTRAKICVFIDGDFWHGYDFEVWKQKLTPYWQKKIGDTIERDRPELRRTAGNGVAGDTGVDARCQETPRCRGRGPICGRKAWTRLGL